MFRAIVAVLLLSGVATLSAQTFRGAIQGTVTDSSGSPVPGAQVVVTSSDTNLERQVLTDDSGNYLFTELPLGTYNVAAQKTGFQKQISTGVRVDVDTSPRIDLTLNPGQSKQVIEVAASVPLVETSGDNQGGTIDARQASELPINGRDFSKAVLLVPGATSDPSSVSDSPGAFGTFSINGNRGRSNNYLLDGTDMNDGYRNDPAINEAGVFGTPATILPLDALAEIPVISGADAEFGRNSGAIVNIVTKSGTNQFHGSAFEFFRNNALDARNYFNTVGLPQNPFHNNQFGGSLGGPIIKDKTFFFVAYEGQREYGGLTSIGHVPTQADINAALASPTVINAGGESPIIANLLATHPWPAPNIPTDANGNNLLAITRFSNTIDSVIAKVDQHFSSGDVFTARYYYGNSNQSFPLALVGGGNLPGYNTVTPTTVQLVSLSYTRVFTPRLLLELRAGYNRFAETFSPQDANFNPESVGLNTVQNGDLGLPEILVSGEATLGANTSVPRGRVDTNWQYFGNASYSTGRNNWKFGYEFRRTFVNGFFDNGYRGRLLFADLPSFLAGLPAGNLTTSNHQAMGNSRRGTYQNNDGLYVQDNIKLTHNFTINLGLRWDYFGVIGEEHGLFSIFDPSIPGPRRVNQLYPYDFKNFAPRVSFAYDVRGNGKTVIRTGWGIFYDAFSQDFFVGQLPFNTFNPGPAYNDIGGPAPILFSSTAAIATAPGPCSGS
ncbi:MAG: TonB-dependent receptor, partial [Acidobacteriaceae bacterium]|nr:TonB-dependent receptor [Acidobacteriaceae bacterium]